MDDQLILGTLDSLYHLGEVSLPTDAGAIGRRLGRSSSEVGSALLHLERRGLVDARTARLTMAGLAAAASLRAHGAMLCPARAAAA